MTTPVVEIENLYHHYVIGHNTLEVIRNISWRLDSGKWVCMLGASGSGKTTLLNLIGALERPAAGSIKINGHDISKLSRSAAARFRRNHIGFVFQSYHLLPELSVLENVMLPGSLAGMPLLSLRSRALELLETVGLKDRLKHLANELSGGEAQRVAIARSLINRPRLLLADEPTGNLDSKTGEGILQLFQDLRAQSPDVSIIMITHNEDISRLADFSVRLQDGSMV